MIISDLYKIAKNINETIGDINVDVLIDLDTNQYKDIQKELYKLQNNTLQGYVEKESFDVILMTVRFLFKNKN